MKSIFLIVLGILVSLLVSILFMGVATEPVLTDETKVMKHEDLKGFQVGAYKEKSSIEFISKEDNIILEINGIYYVFASILSNSSNIERMKNIMKKNNKEYFIKDLSLYEETDSMLEIEALMVNSNSDVSFMELNKKLLSLFREVN